MQIMFLQWFEIELFWAKSKKIDILNWPPRTTNTKIKLHIFLCSIDWKHKKHKNRHRFRTELYPLNEHLWENFNIIISQNEIAEEIVGLSINKGSGPANLIERGIAPVNIKTSNLIPIPKKGSRRDANNYRGIAMESIIAMIFDAIVTPKLYSALKSIIPSCQHGFINGRSTINNLMEKIS